MALVALAPKLGQDLPAAAQACMYLIENISVLDSLVTAWPQTCYLNAVVRDLADPQAV